MAGKASDYNRGEMDIREQAATFTGVMTATKWGSLAVAVGVLFFTLLFCTQTGFGGSFGAAAALAVAGVATLRERAGAH
ncbi:MAG TPA: aa3-type cytochrome c oxidase subunit IV [Caulobacteraceae bacterium]|jgi:hypothetical protein